MCATRKHHSTEDTIHDVQKGLCGEESIAALLRHCEAAAGTLYDASAKESVEAGGHSVAGDTARAATTDKGRPRGDPEMG